MQKRLPGSAKPASRQSDPNCQPGLPVRDLSHHIRAFLNDGKYVGHSPRTLQEEEAVFKKLTTYLENEGLPFCGTNELRQFLLHVREGGMQSGGRWGQGKAQPVRPRTVLNYWSYLRTLFNWIRKQDSSFVSPMDALKKPIARSDQVRPFAEEQIQALVRAAKRTANPLRDEAIVLFLLDTGVRVSEMCEITFGDLDLGGFRCTVRGKGDKHRVIYFGRDTKKALWRYLQDNPKHEDDPLFSSARGTLAGDSLTRAGVLQLIERLGKKAELQGVRCSPHTFRHTSAIRFLNAGGNVFSLQQQLGHTDLAMTKRYLNVAQADLESQARRFSPVDSLRTKKRNRQEL